MKSPKILKSKFNIYQPVIFDGWKYYIVAILGDCGNSGTLSYQLAKWDGFRFFPSMDGVKEEALRPVARGEQK